MPIDLAKFDDIAADDVYTHIHDLATHDVASRRLGYVDRRTDHLEVCLPGANIDLHVVQSVSGLSHSTGYVCWHTANYMADWLLCGGGDAVTLASDMTVVELGSGVGAVLVLVLGPRVGSYVASDQKQILKLLSHNLANNAAGAYVEFGTQRTLKQQQHLQIGVVEFDWEFVEHGRSGVQDLVGDTPIDLVLACDTIYNEYLIPHFVNAFKLLMTPGHTGVLVGLQLRDENLLEVFAHAVFSHGLQLHCVKRDALSQLLLMGFVVYYILMPPNTHS